jgi:lysophospholipase L1-like esterase
MHIPPTCRCGFLLPTVLALATQARADPPASRTFVFGGGDPRSVVVPADQLYDARRGFGFEPGVAVRVEHRTGGGSFATADGPFMFSEKLPEGNYRVTVRLGDPDGESATAVKAETRRVMVPLVRTGKGHVVQVEFTVNVHAPRVDAATSVSVSARERSASPRSWDDKLTLEFLGPRPAVSSIEIRPADPGTITVFLAGDSTVTDQAAEPWAAWGQLLPQFFTPAVAVANYAESGRTLNSFRAEHRWAKILSQLRPGDYVFVQFGHNDMKEKGPGVGAFTTFSASLRSNVADVRAKGGLPVLLTPMHRRHFAGAEIQSTFGDYPEATRRVAAELKVPLIDLQAMSKPLYESFGPEGSKQLFVYFPANAYPGQDKPLHDDTHFRAFGADQIARCVVQSIRDLKLPLAADVRPEVPPFDPAHPGDPAAYDLPASAAVKSVVPEGR